MVEDWKVTEALKQALYRPTRYPVKCYISLHSYPSRTWFGLSICLFVFLPHPHIHALKLLRFHISKTFQGDVRCVLFYSLFIYLFFAEHFFFCVTNLEALLRPLQSWNIFLVHNFKFKGVQCCTGYWYNSMVDLGHWKWLTRILHVVNAHCFSGILMQTNKSLADHKSLKLKLQLSSCCQVVGKYVWSTLQSEMAVKCLKIYHCLPF